MTEDPFPEVREVTREEGVALFDRASRRILGIPGEEFLARWDRGEYGDDDSKAVRLSMLIPFARQEDAR